MRFDRGIVTRPFDANGDLAGPLRHDAGVADSAAVLLHRAGVPQAELRGQVVRDEAPRQKPAERFCAMAEKSHDQDEEGAEGVEWSGANGVGKLGPWTNRNGYPHDYRACPACEASVDSIIQEHEGEYPFDGYDDGSAEYIYNEDRHDPCSPRSTRLRADGIRAMFRDINQDNYEDREHHCWGRRLLSLIQARARYEPSFVNAVTEAISAVKQEPAFKEAVARDDEAKKEEAQRIAKRKRARMERAHSPSVSNSA